MTQSKGKISEYTIIVNNKPITVGINHTLADRYIKKAIKEHGKTGGINKYFAKQFLNILEDSLNSIAKGYYNKDAKISSLVDILTGCTGWGNFPINESISIYECTDKKANADFKEKEKKEKMQKAEMDKNIKDYEKLKGHIFTFNNKFLLEKEIPVYAKPNKTQIKKLINLQHKWGNENPDKLNGLFLNGNLLIFSNELGQSHVEVNILKIFSMELKHKENIEIDTKKKKVIAEVQWPSFMKFFIKDKYALTQFGDYKLLDVHNKEIKKEKYTDEYFENLLSI